MKDKLKERLQCRGCIMPYCDIPCDDLTDEAIDWIMELANQRVADEMYDAICDNPADMVAHLKGIIRELKQER